MTNYSQKHKNVLAAVVARDEKQALLGVHARDERKAK